MSNRLLLAFVLAGAVAPMRAAAQARIDSTAYLRMRLAQLDTAMGFPRAKQALAQRRIEKEEADRQRHVRVQVVGRLTLVAYESQPAGNLDNMARIADSVLAQWGAIPDGLLRSLVFAQWGIDSSQVAAAGLRDRQIARLDIMRANDTSGDNGNPLIESATRWYAERLDEDWRAWFDNRIGVRWASLNADAALNELAAVSGWTSGKDCVAGRIRACRKWLGVDRAELPFADRYQSAELVDALRRIDTKTSDPLLQGCHEGNADYCARYLQHRQINLPLVPASWDTRMSVLQYLRTLRGAEGERRVLADTTGSIGDRLARASGMSEDAFIHGWRLWVLGRGRTERVTANSADALSGLLFTGLLLAMAARSGRWR